jgi:photosystem II stability/assembly factor-like uncharacterized protein
MQLFVSTRKGLFQFERCNGTWGLATKSFLGQNVTLCLPDSRDGSILAALDLGHFGVKVRHSGDGGATWEERPAPVYPPGEQLRTGDGKPPVAATLKLIWALEAGAASQPGRIWAGTLPGGLFRSDDSGRSWELVRSLWDRPERSQWFGGGYDTPGIHSICVDPRNSDIVRIAVSSGGVWVTSDGGATWECTTTGMYAEYMPPEMKHDPNIQDVHRMVQCPGSPDHFWVQHHNAVFRSCDGARTWTDVPTVAPSVFGFAVAVHPKAPETAWFVPAVKDECRIPVSGRLVVARTRDGGRTFEQLARGLPEGECYDIAYRHALDCDATGDRIAFGSTTGGLWLSEDGGDSWLTLSTHLPPVLAVRFG